MTLVSLAFGGAIIGAAGVSASATAASTTTHYVGIVVGKSIDKIYPTETKAQVKAAKGAPYKKGCFRSGVGSCPSDMTQWYYRKHKITVTFVNSKVADVQTDSLIERDAKGVGPGSSVKALKNAHPKVVNSSYYYDTLFLPKVPKSGGDRYTAWLRSYTDHTKVGAVQVGIFRQDDYCAFGCG